MAKIVECGEGSSPAGHKGRGRCRSSEEPRIGSCCTEYIWAPPRRNAGARHDRETCEFVKHGT